MEDVLPPHGGRVRLPRKNSKKKRAKRVKSLDAEIARFGDRFGGQWDYHDANGRLVFAVVRVNEDGGNKRFVPYHPDGKEWVMADPPGKLPLYRLPELAKGDGPVLVVEGEKCADAAARLGLRVITWSHGGKSVKKTDWEPLVGEEVVVWRDNDADGQFALDRIAEIRRELDPNAVTRVVDINKLGLPDKGDIIDWIEARDSREDEDLRAMVQSMMSEAPDCLSCSRDQPKRQKKRSDESAASIMIQMAGVAKLWHTPDRDGWATIPVDEHLENHPIRSRTSKIWLAGRYYRATEKAPNASSVADAIEVLSSEAVFKRPCYEVFVRVGWREQTMYLDLCDPGWRVVEVDAEGWRILSHSPVKFRRPKGARPLPDPAYGGSIEDIFRFVNVEDDDRALVKGLLLGALQPCGSYAILALNGQQGSGKSRTARALRDLIDPNAVSLRCVPRSEHDLAIHAHNSHVVAIDNLSGLPIWLSDALCRLASGAGFGTRKLFRDDEEVLFTGARPIILNGIEDVGSRADLTDRCVLLTSPVIRDEDRKTEEELDCVFEDSHAGILGALLDAVVAAIRNLPKTRLDRSPRMADFARWVVAGESSLGLKPGEFLAAYGANRADASQVALETSRVGMAVMEFMQETEHWEGKAQALLDAIRPDDEGERKLFPRTARGLGGKLRRAAPNLQTAGVLVEFTKGHDRRIVLIKNPGGRPI